MMDKNERQHFLRALAMLGNYGRQIDPLKEKGMNIPAEAVDLMFASLFEELRRCAPGLDFTTCAEFQKIAEEIYEATENAKEEIMEALLALQTPHVSA